MEIVIISIASLVTALLTFFSGFGLGTILMPVFAIFFPVDTAIALTGVVHLSNNLFKASLVGRAADRSIILKFGIPAFLAAFAGAWVLSELSEIQPLYQYKLGSRMFEVTTVKLVIAIMLFIFSILELRTQSRSFSFAGKGLFAGGLLSGFFGGLTGMQGAIRSAFLLKSGLTKEGYIASGVVIACMVDISRLSVYSSRFMKADLQTQLTLVLAATLSAIAGAYVGNRLLKKTTFGFVRTLVTVMLFILAAALGAGLI